MTKTITIGAQKGGSGKTMLAVNLAGLLAEDNKVLLIDADPQANATAGVGVDIAEWEGSTLADILTESELAPQKATVVSPIATLPGLDLIPSNIWLTATEHTLVSRSSRERLLDNYMQDNAKWFAAYDYIIIDTAPNMGVINQNAFFVADSIVLMTDVSYNGLSGVEMFTYLWGDIRKDMRKDDNVAALVINNFDKRIKLADEMLAACDDNPELARLLVKPVIPSRVKFKDTEMDHAPINVIHRGSEEHGVMIELIASLKEKGVL